MKYVIAILFCVLSFNAHAFFLGDAFGAMASVKPILANADMYPKKRTTPKPTVTHIVVCSTPNGLDCINAEGDVVSIDNFVASLGYKKIKHIYLEEELGYFRITVSKRAPQ